MTFSTWVFWFCFFAHKMGFGSQNWWLCVQIQGEHESYWIVMKKMSAVFFALWPQYVLLMLVRQISDCLPIVDGALVVVDCAEGLTEEFCQLFRQAMTQRLQPVLFLNKLDKLLSLEGDDELCYQRLTQIVDSWPEISQDVAQIVLGHRLCMSL